MHKDDNNLKVQGLSSRQAALKMIDAVLRRGEPLEQSAHAFTKGLGQSDRALAIAIAQETFRWLPDIDEVIDGKTQQILPDDAKARAVLRISLAQMLRLGTPHHAVIATALALITGGPKRLVHGILGNVSREGDQLPDRPSITIDTADRWVTAWGEGVCANVQIALSEPPPLDLYLKEDDTTAVWAQKLAGHVLAPAHIRLPRGTAIEELDGFEEGAWWVQDVASSLPVRLMGAGNGRTVLDLCAAPGGKTMQLAAGGWQVTALDKSAKRVERLKENLARTGLSAEIIVADALQWQAQESYDAILIDAPCSATGTFRRHPDVLHRIGARQIEELTAIQAQLLERAALWLKPGGLLVYATCSLEPEEGEAQVARFLEKHTSFNSIKGEAERLPAQLAQGYQVENAYIRTLPGMLADVGGLDGFFVALLKQA